MTDDLITWLRAQLDEDEQVAWAAIDEWEGDRTLWEQRQSPWRVLAEVDAKRRIMAIHHPEKFEGMGGLPQICAGCGREGICDDPVTEDINDCPILRLLALPYADRPGYRDEWKP